MLHDFSDDETQAMIEKELPELFEKEFKVGDWVIGKKPLRPLEPRKILEIKGDLCLYSDFQDGVANNGAGPKHLRHATTEEIKAHLVKEAERRGYSMESVIVAYWHNDTPDKISNGFRTYNLFEYTIESDLLLMNRWEIYRDGKWATIVEDNIEMTLDEAKKRLEGETGKKVKIVLP